MIKTSLVVFLFFNKIIIPKPELTNKPASKEPNDIVLDIYNSVINILEAQLGIRPMTEEYNGVRYLLDNKKLVKLSSPIEAMINPNPTLIRRT